MVRTFDDPGLDDGDRTVLANVRDHGIHVVMVPPDQDTPGWCFSVGMYYTHDFPEVVIFGLPDEVSHWILNEIGCCAAAGEPPPVEVAVDGFLESCQVRLRPVGAPWYDPFLGIANWFYRHRDYPVLQLFWPSRDRLWPWDAAAPDWLRTAQPRLYEASVDAAGTRALLASMGR